MMKKLSLAAVLATAALVFGAAFSAAKDETPAGAQIGKAAPDFTLKDQNGKVVKLSDLKGKIVVLQWFNPDCPFILRHYEEGTFNKLNDKYAGKGVVELAINSTEESTPGVNKQFAGSHGVKFPMLDDSNSTVARAYGARSTPHMFVIDKDGKLAYKGAIDNDPEGEKKDRVNYVSKALDELLAGKPVSTPETKSYGCGVHYKGD
jgi:peroxiredoxin